MIISQFLIFATYCRFCYAVPHKNIIFITQGLTFFLYWLFVAHLVFKIAQNLEIFNPLETTDFHNKNSIVMTHWLSNEEASLKDFVVILKLQNLEEMLPWYYFEQWCYQNIQFSNHRLVCCYTSLFFFFFNSFHLIMFFLKIYKHWLDAKS